MIWQRATSDVFRENVAAVELTGTITVVGVVGGVGCLRSLCCRLLA